MLPVPKKILLAEATILTVCKYQMKRRRGGKKTHEQQAGSSGEQKQEEEATAEDEEHDNLPAGDPQCVINEGWRNMGQDFVPALTLLSIMLLSSQSPKNIKHTKARKVPLLTSAFYNKNTPEDGAFCLLCFC